MNNFYTFIVTSTINASEKLFEVGPRFVETIETLQSIRTKVPDSRIIFIDNSVTPLAIEQKQLIDQLTDISIYAEPNLFLQFSNNSGLKSIGEAYILYIAMNKMKENDLVGKRVFKMSGRYKLSDTFDISFYDNETFINKYIFHKTRHKFGIDQVPSIKDVYDTKLYSLCHTLIDEYLNLIPVMFTSMMANIGNSLSLWEVSNYDHIEKEKVILVDFLHFERSEEHTSELQSH